MFSCVINRILAGRCKASLSNFAAAYIPPEKGAIMKMEKGIMEFKNKVW
jgi:hypothetical protein